MAKALVLDAELSAAPRPGRVASAPERLDRLAGSALRKAVTGWFAVAVLGQFAFAAYLFGFYGRSALQGDWAAWNDVMPHGYVPGDGPGNALVAVHLAFAALIIASGALQLMPWIRRTWPRFHRWNGRGYLFSALLLSLGGLAMVWGRGGVGDLSQNVAISLNALLIVLFASLAWREALARRIDRHRRWAIRLFLAVSGVWFFRIGLTLWIALNQGPAGFDPETFTGPALTVIAFAQYALPLAIAELYFRAQRSRRPAAQLAMAAGLAVATLATGAGIATASMMLWLPHL
ncbi:DUF2306 domain-containing protein [Frateuria hangzhouensis]|uniref:DUF2306 domain-containing protein n=1 Tax=Frateuria hangzhouensis TaxID=2995589 RepID=UPI002260A151|nr:DUF2306 domain-containing protein [Frateuria sp. STR12]MCX7514481.1 DUF2306 domain-containing protein [Frateuria sp. STR12]